MRISVVKIVRYSRRTLRLSAMPKKIKSNRNNNETGRELRVFRDATDLNQEELASLVGCSYRQIGKYERGETTISHDLYLKIREVCQSRMPRVSGLQEEADSFGTESAF